MTNLNLTQNEIKFLYNKLKEALDTPKELLDKLEEEYGRTTLGQLNNDKVLYDIYKYVDREYESLTPSQFLESLEKKRIKIFNSKEEWYSFYLDYYDYAEDYKEDLDHLVMEEITEKDLGKTILDKLFEQYLEYNTSVFTLHGKIIHV